MKQILFALLLFPILAIGQKFHDGIIDLSQEKVQKTKPHLKKAITFKFDKQVLQEARKNATLKIKVRDKEIELTRNNVFGDDFKIVASSGKSEHVSLGTYYIGKGAALSVFNDHIEGFADNMEFGRDESGDGVLYADADITDAPDFVCGTGEPDDQYLERLKHMPRATTLGSVKCVTNFWECQYNIYQQYGSVQAVTDFATTLFNNCSAVYNAEQIGMKLNQLYIWTIKEPYTDDLSGFSSGRRNFNANLAMLLSTTGGGGVAWLGTLCDVGDYYKHSFCGSLSNAGLPLPNYSWSLNVTTHEVGHNLGSPHTHACAWNGNNTAIDGCGPSLGYTEGCDGPMPTHGTIMSYCHLIGNIGIDMALGFGRQPGDLIRGSVASCITNTCEIDTTCTKPTNVIASNITATTAVVSWTAGNNVQYYIIQISGDSGATWLRRGGGNITATTRKIVRLTPSTTYLCRVRSVCGNGKKLTSASISFTTTSAFQ